MALASLLRKSAGSAAPLALRFVRHHSSAANLFYSGGGQLFPAVHRFSTVAEMAMEMAKAPRSNSKLIRLLKEEIDCADDPEQQEDAAEVPAGFPFQIKDNTGEQVVKLTRKYEGETIEVEVYMTDLVTGDDNDDSEDSSQSSLPLLVKIFKDDGPSLEFSCTANADEVSIDSLSVKEPEISDDIAYHGPNFGDLDENLQKAFHKYLNVRGITPSATNFLHEYMIDKDSKEYKIWLKTVKKFIQA